MSPLRTVQPEKFATSQTLAGHGTRTSGTERKPVIVENTHRFDTFADCDVAGVTPG